MKLQQFIAKHSQHILYGTAGFTAIGLLFDYAFHIEIIGLIALIIASIIGVFPIAVKAISALRYKIVSIELLVTIAVIGAFAIQEFHESAIVTFLFLLGDYLEKKTLAKTRQSIKDLTAMAPTTAQVKQADGTVATVDVDDLDKGDIVLTHVGDQIPVDGHITSGQGYVNEAAITGESELVAKKAGDSVYSGTILEDGDLTITTDQVGDMTTFGKIIELVEEAQDSKSSAEKFIDRFAKYYTPAVLVLGILTYIITRDLNLAITLLVLGCPGALVIGAPVSNVAGIGNGAKNGILIKGGEVTAQMSKVDTMVFDKTGTLTVGKPEVATVAYFNGQTPDDLSAYLTKVQEIEQNSNHPLAKAVVTYLKAQGVPADQEAAPQVTTIKGRGLYSEDEDLLIGNLALMTDHNVQISAADKAKVEAIQHQGRSIVAVAAAGALQVVFGISDVLRPNVKATLSSLRQAGVKRLVMLTGDNEQSAQAMAQGLGFDEIHAQLLPNEKLDWLEKYQQQGLHVAFVGDGINDSPALAKADVGVAMGSGTDVAIETADLTLMNSKFESLYKAYVLSRKTNANTTENIVIALAVVALLLSGLLFGLVDMATGMFVHEASILVVIFNAMRLLRMHQRSAVNKENHQVIYEK
ncbi:heavy metal translocating P-type ATPase [Agrilactobacillus yilanensis]|uniref:Cd(2+)-exporting ATPase n=1 Tax=Agrilactobacillus yilanensis TaxID=2485997 RepID=A0ABW4J858_9LACO|nr:heavy metal translocating P-type ATPase [Agrilactobacillus yilanensis]